MTDEQRAMEKAVAIVGKFPQIEQAVLAPALTRIVAAALLGAEIGEKRGRIAGLREAIELIENTYQADAGISGGASICIYSENAIRRRAAELERELGARGGGASKNRR